MIARTLGFLWLSVVCPGLVRAEAPLITVTPHSAFAVQVAERLRAGVDAHAEPIEIVVGDVARGCDEAGALASARATVTIDIASDRVIHVCVHTKDGLSTRRMGPLSALDATAVEQIATVAEATLETLRAPTAATPAAETPTKQPPVARTPSQMVEPTTTPSEPTQPSAAVDTRVPARPPVQQRSQPSEHTETNRAYALGASYQPTLWNGDSIAHALRIGAQASVLPSWLWLGAGLGFTLPFDKRQSGVGASFSALALDLRLGVQLKLGPNATFNVSLGPRLDWLFVGPFVVAATGTSAARSSDAFSLSSVFEFGPTLQIHGNVSATFGVGAIFTHNARNYVVTQGDSYTRVMDQSVPRPYVHVGAQLAL